MKLLCSARLAIRRMGIRSWGLQGVVALLLALTAGQSLAQDSKGTSFWLMFNENLAGGGEVVNLFITGDTVTTGTVSGPGLGAPIPFSVTPGTVTTVNLPLTVRAAGVDSVENKGLLVTAGAEITVYGLNRRTATTDAFLGLPVDILGTEYINLGYQNVNIVNATQFGIVATQNGTTVTITPTVNAGVGRTAGVPYNINLNQGQTYQLRSTGSAPADLSGTIITSNQPIAVFGGHQCSNIPAGQVACDHLVEQLTPPTTWGQSFVTMPLATRLNGDIFRILAGTNNTTVTINGVASPVLNRGQFLEQLIAGPATITANNPVMVAQYSRSSSADGVTSDPFMMLIPPFEQFLAGYTVTTPASGFATNFINVVAPNAAVGSILLDGVAIPPAAYTPIGASGFSGAQRPVALGTHNLSGPLPFGAFMYGFDSFDSYGYPGGMSLAQIAIVTSISLTPLTATNPVGTQHCVDGLVRDQNNAPVPGVRVDYTVTGPNARTGFANAGANGVAQFCYTGTNAGTDTIRGAVGTLQSNSVTKIWTSTGVCDVDRDGDVDKNDLSLISRARGQTAQPGDPRDSDGDGAITPNDVKECIKVCTRPNCAL